MAIRPSITDFELLVYGQALQTAEVSIQSKVELGAILSRDGKPVGSASYLTVGLDSDRHTFPMLLVTPVPRSGRSAPVFVGLNFSGNHVLLPHSGIPIVDDLAMTDSGRPGPRSAVGRNERHQIWNLADTVAAGFAVATACYFDIQQDLPGGSGVLSHFVPEGSSHPPGCVAAWAYGLSRMVDALDLLPESGVDTSRVAVVGHSRLGKAALWAAANDARFGLVIPSQSGTGGVAPNTPARPTPTTRSETPLQITTNFPHWFTPKYAELARSVPEGHPFPIEQVDLVRLIAPRPMLVANAEEDLWANPLGQWQTLQQASSAWPNRGGLPDLDAPPLGLTGHTLAHFLRPGPHSMTSAEWDVFRKFARMHWPE